MLAMIGVDNTKRLQFSYGTLNIATEDKQQFVSKQRVCSYASE